jgi:hypothetical protein
MIRRRRGLSLEVAAGLAGITKSYLSMLELGLELDQRPDGDNCQGVIFRRICPRCVIRRCAAGTSILPRTDLNAEVIKRATIVIGSRPEAP